eukprot:9273260-Alexandrium_andersonii.AAC.1
MASAINPAVAGSMECPFKASQTAGHQIRRCSAESIPMPRSGQHPAGCGTACQCEAHAAGASSPPSPSAHVV